MTKTKAKKNNAANAWVGTLSLSSLTELHAATGLPKSTLVWAGLELFRTAGTTVRAEVIAKHSKAKGSK